MLRKILVSFVVFALILNMGIVPVSVGGPSAPTAAPLLRLHRGTFDARQPVSSRLASTWLAPVSDTLAIIQFAGPPALADRDRLIAAGVQVREYVPDYAYLVQGTADQLAAVARLPNVYARVDFTLADKLSPALLSALQQNKSITGHFRITGWPGEEAAL
jgi:hypothetical protein